jgi:HK97 family phage major capsid protein
MYAGGGNTVSTIGGGSGPSFLGYPVVISQVLNATLGADVSAIKCLFGDLRLASLMGERRGITIKTSMERYFDSDQIGILGTERFDVNNHDLGDGTNAGPIVALKTPGS